MVHHVKDLSADQRLAIESLLGRSLDNEESVTIRPAHMIKDAPSGEERIRRFGSYLAHLDMMAERVKHVPEDEIERIIDEALRDVRHRPE
jgi:hypothetical protein